MLYRKGLKKKTGAALTVVVATLLLLSACGYDYDPVSQEQIAAAETALGDETVYWTSNGKTYHTHEDCSVLKRSKKLNAGTVDQAFAASHPRLCAECADRDSITGVLTDRK